ncbi:HD domain-containing protein [Mucilaginibacter pallidiroseus]|uniref:HD domain-containing protein n=1 Tax=Mucilaginibacter pallidiroseus TaxID=2599295 RepID=A0A563UC63_9SPHI|nr:HD domain-containing protein [Mucilaginibacter pallidiroseus]TWR28955.1 HD domain-containing protein [Mucilaginibacter pallidiroseus]
MIDSSEGKYILQRLEKELPAHFYYHNVDHTLDVYKCTAAIAGQENVTGKNLDLLLIAALYHDSGYLLQIADHETVSSNIARQALTQFGYSPNEVDAVCNIIMATRVPQTPTSLLEEIICDADLDYLGRDDFFTIGQKLFEELKATGQLNDADEWNNKQATFLQQHRYFTKTSVNNRQANQERNLNQIIQKSTV